MSIGIRRSISETPAKTPAQSPGRKRIWRLYDQRNKAADLLTLEDEDPNTFDELVLRHPSDHTRSRLLQPHNINIRQTIEPLLVKY
ncbi:MAG: hypothetical protein R2932_09810 [Caldilineaceae bacterium]